MPKNVEIKARISDLQETLDRAALLSGEPPESIKQEDVFFHAPRGRLKLRFFTADHGELIYYQRADRIGPKTSTYTIVETDRPHQLKAALEGAYGVRNIVRKTRLLYMVGRTRIHIDDVESLGFFLELEVVLEESEDPNAGKREAFEIMQRLGVSDAQLIEGAYIDILESRAS